MNLVRQHRRVRDLRMPDGTLVKLITEHTGVSQVTHRVRDEGQDALVCPEPLIVPFRTKRYY